MAVMARALIVAAVLATVACGKNDEKPKQYKVVGISYCDDLGQFEQPIYLLYKVGKNFGGWGLDGVGKNVFGRDNIVPESPMHLTLIQCAKDFDPAGVDFRGLASELDRLPRPPVCDRQKILAAETIEARASSDLRHEKYDGVIRWPKLDAVKCATGELIRDD